MRREKKYKILVVCLVALKVSLLSLAGCSHRGVHQEWWRGSSHQESMATLAQHLGGFAVAMWEIGYRYRELYWAGQDQNWEYAEYQLEEMREALEKGVERRPARANSTQMILPLLDRMEKLISEKDLEAFNGGFQKLTQSCNACHTAERVSFIRIEVPRERFSTFSLPMAPGP